MLKIKVYRGGSLSEGADLCLKARLFVPGWDLNPTLAKMRDHGDSKSRIAVLFENQQPVALCLFNGDMLMAFCRKDRRRRGYGSRCFDALGRPPHAWAGEGVAGTMSFWAHNGVYALPRRPVLKEAA